MASPRATYRIQFRKEFPFEACAEQADYLATLGVSHVYASPILTARAGSAHGYDVVRYDQINPELGGEAGFREMASRLTKAGIGIILDIVPNHVAVGGADNPMWLDCLKHGRDSRYAAWFDIDFDTPDADLQSKIHAPFLGGPLDAVLREGSLVLQAAEQADGYELRYGEHLFPIRREDDSEIDRHGLPLMRAPESLAKLLARQHYVLDSWRNAGDRINWRRFFEITHLAAVRMEVRAAFDAAHAIPLALYEEGLIDGLRVDHIDGLADPAAYCTGLRAELDRRQASRPARSAPGRAWLVVEKILAAGETLPLGWQVDGTTGYDFMEQVSALQHHPKSEAPLASHWAGLSGRPTDFHTEEAAARRQVLDHSFDGQRERLIDTLIDASADEIGCRGVTRAALRRACTDTLVEMRAYRGYRGDRLSPQIEAALTKAAAQTMSDRAALDLLKDVLAGKVGDARAVAEALRRFNQLSAPLAAKAVEDTAFYRFGRLLSRNDVGFDAARLGLKPGMFHDMMSERVRSLALSMLCTATHDHKRGEDVRSRLAVLSEMPSEWIEATSRWLGMTATLVPDGLSAGDVYLLFQMMVGSWPPALQTNDPAALKGFAERLAAWMTKAMREAKLSSNWAQPNTALERDVERFVATLLDPDVSGSFLEDVTSFVSEIERPGAANGLVQAALRCLVPGIPDLYQGTEFWDFSLVDPDNRRAVDFATRRAALTADEPLSALTAWWRDGHIKQAMLRKLLQLRHSREALFAHGTYVQLDVSGPRADHVVGFVRQHGSDVVLMLAARCLGQALSAASGLAPGRAWWGETVVNVLSGIEDWLPVIGPKLPAGNTLSPADAFPELPVAVWTGRAAFTL